MFKTADGVILQGRSHLLGRRRTGRGLPYDHAICEWPFAHKGKGGLLRFLRAAAGHWDIRHLMPVCRREHLRTYFGQRSQQLVYGQQEAHEGAPL